MDTQDRQVLPKNVKPLHYDLTLEPDFETFTFEGTVAIDLDVLEDSSSISLNTKDLEFQSTKVEVDGATLDAAPELTYDADSETTTVKLGSALKAGQKARLSHNFTGKLNDTMAGFYRASWKGEDGTEHWMASTQMEATDARRAFPCFDEPALKATFTVTIIADHALTCLGNMDVASETDVDSKIAKKKRKAVTFNKTPIMSTYLVAFVVSDLKVYVTNKFRLPVRVFCTPDQDIEHGVYAAELAARTLEFYEREFDIPYPLPKMDMVAIPDFAAGAMENWGLVTYRSVALMLDEKKSSAAHKHSVAETVQHELAHQWFGNLVTMEFWDGLWLNEGFATWMSWYSCNYFYPEWTVWDGYVTDNLSHALSIDALRSSHPVEVPVKRADEVNQIFDEISYSKGSSVVRMVSKYLGEDVFMKGIRAYLKKHAYGNTVTNDLWAALSEASGKDVEQVAAVWTREVGYPVVSVNEDEKNGQIHVKQNRFLGTGDVKPEEDKVLYPVSLGLRTKSGVEDTMAFNTREASFPMADWDFFKLNAEHSGFYRTSYATDRLSKLGENAKAGLLPVSDRAGLISDAAALAQAGYQKTSGLLSLLQSFDSEPEYQVWDEIITRLDALDSALTFEDEKLIDALKAFQRDIFSAQAHKIGWTFGPNDGHIEQQFKALMFSAACRAGDEKARSAAYDMFAKFKDGDRDAIHPNLRKAVYTTVLRHGGEADYDVIRKEYETASLANEKNAALLSLGIARDPKLMKRTLEYALSKEVKSQDVYLAIVGLKGHKKGAEALWVWTTEKWDVLTEKFPAGLGMLGSMVQIAVTSFTKESQRQMVQAFFDGKSTKGFDMELAQALDVIRIKEGWLARDKSDIEQWLRSHGYLKG